MWRAQGQLTLARRRLWSELLLSLYCALRLCWFLTCLRASLRLA
jgi:hypothetical protein